MGRMHASNSEPAAAEFTSIERSQCGEVMHEVWHPLGARPHASPHLLGTRRSLPDACTNSFDIFSEPARFGPPGDACIDEGLDNLRGAFAIITGSFSFPDDVKGCREGAMVLDIGFHGTDVVRRHRVVVPRRGDFCREQSIVTQYTQHRFHAWPGSYYPDRNTRRLHRGRLKGHFVEMIMLALKMEWLPAP